MIAVGIMAPLQARRLLLEQTVAADSSLHLAGAVATFPLLRSLIEDGAVDVALADAHEVEFSLIASIPTVVLDPEPDRRMLHTIYRAERGALLRPDATAGQLVQAIHGVAAGLLVFDSSLIEAEAVEDVFEELTPREMDVLRLLAEGHANREIADQLNISEHTIKFHIRSILGKLGASTRTEAVTRGFRAGLIEL